MAEEQNDKETRQLDYLIRKLGFSQQDILDVCSHPGWNPGRIIAEFHRLDQIPGFQGEQYAREHFFEANPDLLEEYSPAQEGQPNETNNILSFFLTLDQFEQKEAEWLFAGYIPKGQITTLASDGGIGKTSVWVDLAAAVSSGSPSILSSEPRQPGKVLYLSTEDSTRVVLKKRLLTARAIEKNVIAPDFSAKDPAGILDKIKFGSKELDTVLDALRPDLCIFDPIQGFIPKGTQMGDRAAMRACLAPLISMGEKYGTTFLIICHTNKRQTASGRDRIADSADVWDISRSVLMMGWTEEEGVRYLSHEKCNYGRLQDSILFTVDNQGLINTVGTTWKRDRDYQAGSSGKSGSKPTAREDCETWLIRTLEEQGGKMLIKELDHLAVNYGFSEGTLKRAKSEAAKDGKTRSYGDGYGKDKKYYIRVDSVRCKPLYLLSFSLLDT